MTVDRANSGSRHALFLISSHPSPDRLQSPGGAASSRQPKVPGTPAVDTSYHRAREYAMGAMVTYFCNRLGRALGYNPRRARLERFDADSQ